jgi:hypothetical protein
MAAKKRSKKIAQEEPFVCPLCMLVSCAREMVDRESPFFEHMNNARIEFLEGIKALLDARIQAMKKEPASKKSKLTKIKVED